MAKEPDRVSAEPADMQTEGLLVEATGLDGQVQLFKDKAVIRRQGLLAFGSGEDREIPIRYLDSVMFKSGINGGYIRFVLGGQEAKRGWGQSSEYEVQFTYWRKKSFEKLRQTVEQLIADRPDPAEKLPESQQMQTQAPTKSLAAFNTTTISSTTVARPASNIAGGAEILSKKLSRLAQQHMSDDENIEFCLLSGDVGGWNQAIVALSDRLLVIKPGFMAGATFGTRATSFYYRDINGIEVNTGLINGVIEINTPSYQGTAQKDFWNIKDENKDPYKVTNCLPISKLNLKDYKPYIDRLRESIREAKKGQATPPQQSSVSLSSELEKLASLRDSGILTKEEFQQAKMKLLGS